MATESRTFDEVPVKASKWRLMPVGVTGSWIVDEDNRLVGTIHDSEDARLAAAAPMLLEVCKNAYAHMHADASQYAQDCAARDLRLAIIQAEGL